MCILDNFNIGKMFNILVHISYADIHDRGQQAIFLFESFNYTLALWKEYNQSEPPVM